MATRDGSFWQGLTSPSLASVVGAVVIALVEFVFSCALITQRNLAQLRPGWLAHDRSDEYARLTIDALQLRYRSGPEQHVVYIGPSTARLAISDAQRPDVMSRILSAASHRRVRFHNFTADALTIEDAYILLDYLPASFDGLVVFTMSDTRNPTLREKERLGLDEPPLTALANEALTTGPLALGPASKPRVGPRDIGQHQDFQTGVSFIDHLSFFAARRGSLVRTAAVPLGRPMFNGRKAPPAHWARATHVARTRSIEIVRRQIREVAVLSNEAQERGADFVIMEAPINPRFEALKPPELRTLYASAMADFADENDVPYWDFSPEVNFDADDFMDAVHVASPLPRARWQRAFVREVTKVLIERHPQPK